VQGVLLGRLLKVMPRERIALAGLVSSTLAFIGWGLSTEPWMLYAVIFANVLGAAVAATLNSVVSGAADAGEQGRTMGAVGSLSSLMAVIAPLLAAPLMAAVSHLPRADWRVGVPMFFCAALQGLALVLAWWHFRARRPTKPGQPAPHSAPAAP
jgi:MFS transporter, DHA1 family, tetracycline resistance protein